MAAHYLRYRLRELRHSPYRVFYLDWDYLTAGMGEAVLIDNVNAF